METPSGVNLELSLLGEDRHRLWDFVGGSRGSTTTNPQMESGSEVPPGIITYARWEHSYYTRLHIEVLFQGTDNENPLYTLKIADGDSLDADTIEEQRNIHARDITSKVDDAMERFATKEMIKQKLNPRRLKQLFK